MPFNGKTKWILWLAGVLFMVMFTIVTALANNMIKNDNASRDRDTKLRECIHLIQTEVVERLARIETNVDHIAKFTQGGN